MMGVTALTPSFCVLYCKHQNSLWNLYIFFYACVRLRFLDVETNTSGLFPLSADYSIVMGGDWPGALMT